MRWSDSIRQIPLFLLASGLVGGATSLPEAWPYAAEGLMRPALRVAVSGLSQGLAHGILFLALYIPLFHLVQRLTRRLFWSVAVAAAIACLPFFAYWGKSIDGRELLLPHGWERLPAMQLNLRIMAIFLGAGLVLFAGLYASARSRWGRGWTGATGMRIAVVLLAMVGLAGPWFLRVEPSAERPNVVFVLIDALRADHLGSYGYARDTSPHLDALAQDGVRFAQAISHSTFTKCSIASLFTGKNPYLHGVYAGNRAKNADEVTSDILQEGHLTLAEAALHGGLTTVGFVENAHLQGFMGFGQGFIHYLDRAGGAEYLNHRLLPWLGKVGTSGQFFSYVHYIDLHDPYFPPPPYDGMFGETNDVYAGIDLAEWGAYLAAVRSGEQVIGERQLQQMLDRYDGLVRYLDFRVGEVVAELHRLDLYDDTLLIVTSDHGDGFMEHGFISHSVAPYDELLHVPLLIKLPGSEHGGTVVTDQVRLVDLYPTILDVLGLPAPPMLSGRSLMPKVEGRPEEPSSDPLENLAVSEIINELSQMGSETMVSIRGNGLKFIRFVDGSTELYDLEADPGETTNLVAARPDLVTVYEELLERIATQRVANSADEVQLDEETLEKLRALGYIE